MSKITEVKVHYADKVDSIFVKRLKYTQQMRLYATLNVDSKPSLDANGKPVLDKEGNPEVIRTAESVANYQLGLIAASVCDKKGMPTLKVDDIDSWTEDEDGAARITAYTKAINLVLSPPKGELAGNSSPTVTDSSSSV